MNTMTSLTPPLNSQPWWREPYVWLVVGGPLVVVVAAFITAFIAFAAPDPVLDKNRYEQALLEKAAVNKDVLEADLAKVQPANKARNNAASPVVPHLGGAR